MKLVKITDNFAIFRDKNQIITKPLTEQAKSVLYYYNRLPANR